jgi:hypothetical protein
MHNESYPKLPPTADRELGNRPVSLLRSVGPSAQTANLLRTPPASVTLLPLQQEPSAIDRG